MDMGTHIFSKKSIKLRQKLGYLVVIVNN
jgi:hypothetical protein